MKRLSVIEKLQDYTLDSSTGCHIWNRGLFQNGYGQIKINGSPKKAHRVSYEHYVGSIPEGLIVRHSCHNKRCINPVHLSTGTTKDNSEDMVKAGRSLVGSRNCNALLTEADVLEIKQLLDQGIRTHIVAKMFNKRWKVIWDIREEHTWKHVSKGVKNA